MESLEDVARKTAVTLILEGISAANPREAVKRHLRLEGEKLVVGDLTLDLPNEVYVVGAGKATGGMAEAVESILGDRITAGVISVPKELAPKLKLRRVEVVGATHPRPGPESVEAGKRIVELAKEAGESALVIALFSGGGSALMEYPVEGVKIEEISEVSIALMNAGCDIFELNTVRKHLSRVKGGWLAKHAYPARVMCLMISDVVGDRMDTIASGPTVPDPTTFEGAYRVLKKYGIWEKAPSSVREYIERGLKGEAPETPKPGDPVFERVHNLIVASNILSLSAMKRKAKELGYNALVLTSLLEGEAREVAKVVAAIAKEIRRTGNPLPPPAVVLMGGETTVTVRGKGKGGRNQELALAAAIEIEGERGVAIAAVGSDGRDGPTDAAGAIVDGNTAKRAREAGVDPVAYLEDNNSYEFFRKVGGHIILGYTGTNVNDFVVIVVEKEARGEAA